MHFKKQTRKHCVSFLSLTTPQHQRKIINFSFIVICSILTLHHLVELSHEISFPFFLFKVKEGQNNHKVTEVLPWYKKKFKNYQRLNQVWQWQIIMDHCRQKAWSKKFAVTSSYTHSQGLSAVPDTILVERSKLKAWIYLWPENKTAVKVSLDVQNMGNTTFVTTIKRKLLPLDLCFWGKKKNTTLEI